MSSPASFKTIDIYYIYRDDTLIAVTTNNEYTYADQLLVDTQYNYSVIANSCAGNSTQGIERITIESKNIYFVYKLIPNFITIHLSDMDNCVK